MHEDRKRDKILLYYNAHSGNGTFMHNLDYIVERCQDEGYQLVPVRTTRDMVQQDAFSRINPEEYSRVIAAGGDGTINLCVSSMIRNGVYLPMGILPAGTANDFAYYFELPNDLESQMDIALGNKTTKADVGKANSKYFVNVASMGTLIDVSQKTNQDLKNTLGLMAYYMKAVTELPQLKPMPVTLTTPEKTYEEEIFFMVIMNGESAGGFRKLSPQSSMNDGMLDVIAFRKMPIVELPPLLLEVVSGRHPRNKNVLSFRTESLRVDSPVHIGTDIDGEHGERLPIEFSVLSERMEIFVSEETWKYDDREYSYGEDENGGAV